ncbi:MULTISPECIES: hypothetical protein [Ralstonia solanacearum species complex]|uniref:hypothetical protein n=1 Tax=Ralstonia phage RS138 TaxID=1483485 RepID=UPI0006BD4823|nr:hypothetical protein [Ralstonia solanacearum]YP_009226520.1 hypothetical protein AXI85_gp16 [Ralstonia phage RS138]BEU74001.1 hypothetical protein MAFF211271_35560 [Ralstonia pseudosolanacearum]AXV78910.1 hypothetical protein CJO76_18095 [Ralstonia solanacearum]AXV92932.1 hypothetical protein CJO79_18080 [Ralstonia solanacearum]AXW20994.1 hypothetical protein CJO85_18125 [Ralstonia solanacearum]AXW77830.1 hypothetical protein CJO97_18075 [Ralstonia solanacearum]
MALPSFHCPVCRNVLTAEVVFAHEGVRDAVLQLVSAHPDGAKLLRPLLGYVGMFAPAKTEMRYERVATVLAEVVASIKTGTVRDGYGVTHAAPLDYWRMALEEMAARRDTGQLKLPLKSHGYLHAVVVGLADKASASDERKTEAQRAGHAGAGTATARQQPVMVSEAKRPMPADVRKTMLSAAGSRRAETLGEQ